MAAFNFLEEFFEEGLVFEWSGVWTVGTGVTAGVDTIGDGDGVEGGNDVGVFGSAICMVGGLE